MKLAKEITLTAYTVEYFDLRQPKPRTPLVDSIVLDGGRISALRRLGKSDHGYIAKLYEAQGFGGVRVIKGRTYTVPVELSELWEKNVPAEQPEAAPEVVE